MGFIKEKYSNNRAGLVVCFRDVETNENYIDTDSVKDAMQHFHLRLENNQLYAESDDALAIKKIGIAIEEASELRSLMDDYAASLTDEDALNKMVLFANWAENAVEYKTGERIRFNGKLYVVLKDHVSQSDWTPAEANSLFALVLKDAENGTVLEWMQPDSTNGYATGDLVMHNGICYKSLVDNNVWEPGTVGSETLWNVVN